MNKSLITLILSIILLTQLSQAQEFSNKEQYSQAMRNAKLALTAQQFSEAIMFYREAIDIDPDALLPKYKIEDIRTIYIEKELDSILAIPPNTNTTNRRKKKKELEAEKIQQIELAKKEAAKKMDQDARKAQSELKLLVLDIDENIDPLELDENIIIEDMEVDKEVVIKNIAARDEPSIANKANTTYTQESQEKEQKETINETKNITNIKVEETNNNIIQHNVIKKATPTKPSSLEKKIWVAEEKERLLKTYPNKKYIEEIEKPGKHITRIVMNIDNRVTIYLKVKHSWGATYFFIDEVGLELKSISENFFNTKTNLKNYGG